MKRFIIFNGKKSHFLKSDSSLTNRGKGPVSFILISKHMDQYFVKYFFNVTAM